MLPTQSFSAPTPTPTPTPTSTSSSSAISTVASQSSLEYGTPMKKRFACSFTGCGKAFSRSEHLHRHALNHKDGNSTCPRCMAHFRRRDLLDRHMLRHKKKDEEAGGEGLGILATRKRLWRDGNGNIVNTRRPSYALHDAKVHHSRRPEKLRPAPLNVTSCAFGMGKPLAASSMLISPLASPAATITVKKELSGLFDDQLSTESQQDTRSEKAALPSPPISEPYTPRSAFVENPGTFCNEAWLGMRPFPEPDNNVSMIARSLDYTTSSLWDLNSFQPVTGTIPDFASDDFYRSGLGLYNWPTWNSQMVMSRGGMKGKISYLKTE